MKLLFVGDVMLGRMVNRALKELPPEYPWGDTLEIFRDADARFCNLECAISDRGAPWSPATKAFHFRSDAKNVEVLRRAAIDAVSLANNHILDFEEVALRDTLDILDRNRIHHAGAGRNALEAEAPAVFRIGGRTAALFAFSDNEPGWRASKRKPGIFYLPADPKDGEAKRFCRLVEKTKGKADLVVVSAHWGPNWGYEVPEEHVAFAHALVDSGADVVFGHSAHVFRAVEIYRHRPIFYSAGDFVDDYAVDAIERNDESFLFMVDVNGGRYAKVTLHPATIGEFQANLAEGARARSIAVKMQALCRAKNTSSSWRERARFLELTGTGTRKETGEKQKESNG
ncbi:MAG: CapA family protein [Deltaproteobacteria bacterium]|nr:CapA family protein [Deltaproteobacteria bacterium]